LEHDINNDELFESHMGNIRRGKKTVEPQVVNLGGGQKNNIMFFYK
jgi:hypothetical protein